MPRQGITYNEVANAAIEIKSQGKNPTVEQIRMVLGTGSSTTIANHLKTWKSTQSTTSILAAKEHMPDELVASMKGLWERVTLLSDEKIQTAYLDYEKELSEKQAELNKYRNNNKRWQQLYNRWNAEKEGLREENQALRTLIESMKEEFHALNTSYKLANQQLVEKQDRLQELHHLQQQAQKNFDDYKQASQQQRQEEITAFNQKMKELAKENSVLKNDVTGIQNDYNILRNQFQKTCLERDTHKNHHELTSVKLSECQAELTACQKLLHEQSFSAEHWQKQFTDSKIQLASQAELIVEVQAQFKSSHDQLQVMQNENDSLRNQIKSLEKENWSLQQRSPVLI